MACLYGASNVAAVLLENGADVNSRANGLTLLHLTTGYGMEAMKGLRSDIDWDELDKFAKSPRNFLGLTRVLVEHGTNVNALSGKTDAAGKPFPRKFSEKTPLDFAEAIEAWEIARYLESVGAKSAKKWYWPF